MGERLDILKNIFKPVGSKPIVKYEFLINNPDSDAIKQEQFKSRELEEQNVKWQKALQDDGLVDHPFDFEQILNVISSFGPARATVDKYHDFILSPGFYVDAGDKRANKILYDYNQQHQLYDLFSRTLKGTLGLGTIVVEFSTESIKGIEVPNGFKLVQPSTVYFRKNDAGKIIGVVQKRSKSLGKEDTIELDMDKLIIFTCNKMPGKYYGDGIIYPAMHCINEILGMRKHMMTLLQRKANSPIVAKLGGMFGQELINPTPGDLQAFGKELQVLTPRTELTIPFFADISVLNFPDVGTKFNYALENGWQMFFSTVQIPEILFGKGNIPEGLATVQMDGFERSVQSKREEFEKPLEEKLYRKILDANGFTELQPEIIWGLPSTLEKNERLKSYALLLGNPLLSGGLRDAIEKETAILMDLVVEKTSEEERKEELKEPQPRLPQLVGKEGLEEGWVTGSDGRHYYIDDDGNSYSGKDAMFVSNRDKGWKPSMSQKEADEWGKDSVIKSKVYHGTMSQWGKDNITNKGFEDKVNIGNQLKPNIVKRAVFVTDEKDYADNFSRGNTLKLKINVKKVKELNFDDMTKLGQSDKLSPFDGVIKKYAKEYDAIKYKAQDRITGQPQKGYAYMIFNKKSITAVQ